MHNYSVLLCLVPDARCSYVAKAQVIAVVTISRCSSSLFLFLLLLLLSVSSPSSFSTMNPTLDRLVAVIRSTAFWGGDGVLNAEVCEGLECR